MDNEDIRYDDNLLEELQQITLTAANPNDSTVQFPKTFHSVSKCFFLFFSHNTGRHNKEKG